MNDQNDRPEIHTRSYRTHTGQRCNLKRDGSINTNPDDVTHSDGLEDIGLEAPHNEKGNSTESYQT